MSKIQLGNTPGLVEVEFDGIKLLIDAYEVCVTVLDPAWDQCGFSDRGDGAPPLTNEDALPYYHLVANWLTRQFKEAGWTGDAIGTGVACAFCDEIRHVQQETLTPFYQRVDSSDSTESTQTPSTQTDDVSSNN